MTARQSISQSWSRPNDYGRARRPPSGGVGRALGWGAIVAGAAGLFLCRFVIMDAASEVFSSKAPPPAVAVGPAVVPPALLAPPVRVVERIAAPVAALAPITAIPVALAPVASARVMPVASAPAVPVASASAVPVAPPAVSPPMVLSTVNRPVATLPHVETPSAAVVTGMGGMGGNREAIAERRRDGHFVFNTMIRGEKVPMMFDTGATMVVLRAEDAMRAGIDPDRINYSAKMRTANGIALAAPVTIDSLTVGGITARNVAAVVSQRGALSENLLGQSFMVQLAGYNVDGDRLILKGH